MSITLDTIDSSLHSISIKDSGGDELAIAADGSITVTDNGTTLSIDDGGGSITVDGSVTTTVASDHVEDSAHTTGDTGSFMLAVRSDVKSSSAGTDGDYAALIQDADGDLYVSDTVAQTSLATIAGDTTSMDSKMAALGQGVMAGSMPVAIASDQSVLSIDDNGGSLTVDGSVSITGALPAGTNNIGDVDVLSMPGIYVEDVASSGGENLMLVGGYRRDANTSPVSADGDFHGFIFNASGELKTSTRLDDVADSSVSVTTTTVDTTVGGVQLVTSGLANRRDLIVQNLGSQDIWVKDGTGVTSGSAGNGFKIPKGSSASYSWGPNIDLYAITAASTASVKIVEAA